MAKINPRYVSTFRAPTEYERQIEEARRRAALAEALAQQEYQPMEGAAAPIPAAAPLVKALQGYMTARAGRQAEEAKTAAEKAGRTEAVDYMRSFDPEQRTVGVGDIAAMEASRPYLEGGQLRYDPASAVAAPNQRLMPAMTPTGEIDVSQPMQMQIGGPLSIAQKRARALEGFESNNPLVQQFALSQYEKTMPKELGLTVAPIDPSKIEMASVAEAQRTGDISKIKPRAAAPETITPYQQAQLDIDRERLAFQKSRGGQAADRPKAPSGYRYTDVGDLEPIPGGPQDPDRVRDLPQSVVVQITQEKRNVGKFTNALKTTNNFISMIEGGELPLNKLSAAEYATKRAFDLARNETGDPTEPYVRYYELERFVNQQVNTILSAAKGPQTDQDALRARQQILDNPNNEKVVLSALRDLQRIWNEEIELSSASIEDLTAPYGRGSRNRGARGSW